MPFFKFENIKISAVAGAVPKQIYKSIDYETVFGAGNVQKIIDMTGVNEHRETHCFQTASDLGYAAAENLLKKSKIDRKEIGLLVFGSHSGDYRRPATACVLQKRLQLDKNCAVFDVSLGCSAFCYCVGIAASMLQCSTSDKALVIVGETPSKLVNKEDKSSTILFGDAGAAVLLEKCAVGENIIQVLLCSDGERYKAIIAPAGGFRNMNASTESMVWSDGNIRNLYNLNMNGVDVFSFAISDVVKSIKDFWQITQTQADNYDCFAFHQANQFIHKQLAKKLHIPMEKMPLSISKYGNTSAPSIPLTLCDAYGNLDDEHVYNTLMCGFGVGLSWGILSASIIPQNIYPVIETDEYFSEGIINSPDDL